MSTFRTFVLTVLVVAIVAACASSGASSSPATPTLDGHTYLSTVVQGRALAPGTRITLTFMDGNLTASGGCNTMGGTYAVIDGRMKTSAMFMTEMACQEPRMAQEAWLSTYLSDVGIILDGDTLTLDGGGVQVTLVDREVADPDRPIEGTRWVVDGVITGDAVSSVPNGVTAWLRIANGQLEVDTGCNTGGGSVQVTADTLVVGPIGLTKKGCQAGPAAMESAVTTILSGTVAYTIEADVLTLDAGVNGLILRATP